MYFDTKDDVKLRHGQETIHCSGWSKSGDGPWEYSTSVYTYNYRHGVQQGDQIIKHYNQAGALTSIYTDQYAGGVLMREKVNNSDGTSRDYNFDADGRYHGTHDAVKNVGTFSRGQYVNVKIVQNQFYQHGKQHGIQFYRDIDGTNEHVEIVDNDRLDIAKTQAAKRKLKLLQFGDNCKKLLGFNQRNSVQQAQARMNLLKKKYGSPAQVNAF